ncbi:natural killer cell receptor 2B4 isoform X1 [Sapajus apella]|uniref:Natural killer cell receptor 2B4 isoform X1 n=1 Tax=Sapajus apella TaxID=9515 RepID=A0A6J3GG69_SAPAP|nr:natural killer cell receptor 2B4 isoform X1 [Sapajus apella]
MHGRVSGGVEGLAWSHCPVGMLGQVVTLTLLLLLKGYQGQECQIPADHVVSISGEHLQLQPNSTQMKVENVQWKMRLPSREEFNQIFKWENGLTFSASNDRFHFEIESPTLLIKAAQPQDSGFYCLEATYTSGQVLRAAFQVSVFDTVEKPRLQGRGKILDSGRCQVALSCLVSRDGNVTYAWYRGSKLIQTAGNLTYLEEVDVDGLHTYTCNVSNPVSWESRTLNLTQGCQNARQEFRFWPFLVIVVILSTLLLGTLACFCVWRRKKKGKPSETSTKEFLTIYEDVKERKTRRNQMQGQTFLGEGTSIYSMIQSQTSTSTSQEPACTLYSLVQPSRKSGSRKRNHSPSFNRTVHEEIRVSHPKARNPARLSRKELENFDVYS